MARTHRDKLHTAAAKNAYWDEWKSMPPGAYIYQFKPYIPNRMRGGNMVMSQSASGIWDDERSQNGPDRKKERRNQKRRERQRWRKEADNEVS